MTYTCFCMPSNWYESLIWILLLPRYSRAVGVSCKLVFRHTRATLRPDGQDRTGCPLWKRRAPQDRRAAHGRVERALGGKCSCLPLGSLLFMMEKVDSGLNVVWGFELRSFQLFIVGTKVGKGFTTDCIEIVKSHTVLDVVYKFEWFEINMGCLHTFHKCFL